MIFLQFRDPLSDVEFLATVLALFIVSVGGGKAGEWSWEYG